MIFEKLISPIEDVNKVSFIVVASAFMAYVLLRAIILEGGLYLLITYNAWAKRKRVYRVPFSRGQFKSELKATVWNIIFDGLFIAVLVQVFPPNQQLNNYWTAFIFSFVWIEIWFYVTHYLFHTKPLYFIHRQHHVATVTSPFTAMSFSLLERAILLFGAVGVIALVSAYVWPLAPFGIALALVINYLLNLFAHSNLEVIPPSFVKLPIIGRIFNAPTYHAMHHARYKGNYGLYTPFLDWIFKTQFEDYLQVQEAAYQGNGPTVIHQRFGKQVRPKEEISHFILPPNVY